MRPLVIVKPSMRAFAELLLSALMMPSLIASPAASMIVFDGFPLAINCTPDLKMIGKTSPRATL
ncbi:hypothetical protein D3C83_141080 [compost metagenome]